MKGEEELNHMKRTLPSHHLTYETKGLQPHLEYQYWVTASTKIGEGQSSKIATQILSTTRSKRSIMHIKISFFINFPNDFIRTVP